MQLLYFIRGIRGVNVNKRVAVRKQDALIMAASRGTYPEAPFLVSQWPLMKYAKFHRNTVKLV
jgi:hypothetical protein